MSQKIKIINLFLLIFIAGIIALPAGVKADCIAQSENSACGVGDPASGSKQANDLSYGNGCANEAHNASGRQNCLSNNQIVKDLNVVVNVLAGLVGVVAVTMIIVGGIRYSLARNNPQATAAARGHIINALVALVFFMLIWALLQWLIPGGVFN